MRCLRKFQWVKLFRDKLPDGKGILGFWAKLAACAAYRNGTSLYCGFENEVAAGTWVGGVVGVKSILGLNSRQQTIEILDKLVELGYIEYEIEQKTKKLIEYVGSSGEVVIPECVVEIASFAFSGNKNLKKITIPSNVKRVNSYAFDGCSIADIKAHHSKSKSISTSQILFSDYSLEKARTVLKEMVLDACHKMMRQKVVTNSLSIYVGYSKDVISPTGGTVKLLSTTNLSSEIMGDVVALFDRTTIPGIPVRRLGVTCNNVITEGCEGYSLFTNFEKIEKERKLEHTVLELKDKFGKNSMLRAIDLEDGATAIERNKLVGGHNE